MANDLTKTPLKIDTAGAGVLAIPKPVRVKRVRWVGATTAGHVCEIQDADSRVLWRAVAAGPNYTEAEWIDRHWGGTGGIKVPTLQSGILYLDVEHPTLD